MQLTEILLFNSPTPVYIKANGELKINQRVVVDINGSLELGLVKLTADFDSKVTAEFVRLATNEDNRAHCENCKYTRSLLADIKSEAKKLNLDMKIGFISTNLDRSKLVINYTADGRIDFRELVKILGSKYKMRIEMHQIGNRDESKVLGAIGVCGRETCCKLFLSDFDKVSIKMAKNQNLALNPTRINGMCGRLLCCLKYEDEFYEEMQKKMPRVHSKVETESGIGTVTAVDFLKETVSVEFNKDESTEVKVFPLEEIRPFKTNK